MTSPRIAVVIPAFREEQSVGAVVESLKPYASDIIVVDDQSPDATGAVAERAGATVIRHAVNRGYDASLDDGFKEAARRGAGIIVTFDADGEHEASDLPRLLAPILEGRADIVAGARTEARHWSEKLFALYTRTRYGVRDPLCGLKLYRREVYDRFGFFDSVRSIGTELMIRAARAGFRVVSEPITLHERVDGRSRFYAAAIRGNLRIVRAMLRVMFV